MRFLSNVIHALRPRSSPYSSQVASRLKPTCQVPDDALLMWIRCWCKIVCLPTFVREPDRSQPLLVQRNPRFACEILTAFVAGGVAG